MPLNHYLRPLWVEAGLPHQAGSAGVCAPPPKGFTRAYYLTSSEYALSNIIFGRLKVSRFSELNDPFELLAPRGAQTHSDKEIRSHRENFDAVYGLLCFSSDWIDPVLWSHYGARHQGICLGFDIVSGLLRDVEYRTDRISIDPPLRGMSAKLVDAILRTKFESWKYEREKRMLVPLSQAAQEGELYFVPFDDEMILREVILGPLCDHGVEDMRRVVEGQHKNVVTFKARLAHKSFNVVPKESTVPPVSTTKARRMLVAGGM